MKDIGITSDQFLQEEMNALGMTSTIDNSPTGEKIQNYLKEGKVMLVSVGAATKFTNNSHIMAIVDINTDGQVYIVNPSTTTEDGWFNVSDIMVECDYLVVTDAGATGVADTSGSTNTSGYVAVVATWSQSNTSVTVNNDPNINPDDINSTRYTMTSTTVNYRGMVDRYSMPFDFLWVLLVCGQEKEFVFELADLVYNSDIQLTIYDNLTVTKTVNTKYHEQETKKRVDINISGMHSGGISASRSEANHDDGNTITPYTTTTTTITYTNTINQVLTKADTWIVDYTNTYEYSGLEQTSSESKTTEDDKQFPSEPDSIGNTYSCGHTEAYKQQIIDEIKAAVDENNRNLIEFDSNGIEFSENYVVRVYNRNINISTSINTLTETKKFTEGQKDVKEKTKLDVDEDENPVQLNFVTIYRKSEHSEARKNINSITELMFKMIEKNGKPDVDLVRYLLYKATGNNYGITEYDFSEYDASKFRDATGGQLYGDSIPEQVWWALIDAGYSKVATAAVLGNIQWESGFKPSVIESSTGNGIGLCQWSFGRRTQFEAYIAHKGTDTSDVQTQIEFLLGELNTSGGADGYATHQMGEPSSSGYDGTVYTKTDWENEKTDVGRATAAFMAVFERPGYDESTNHLSWRKRDALKYYNQFKDKEKPTTDSRIGPINLTGNNATKMQEMLTEALRIADDDKYYYDQDNRWGEYSYDCSSFVYRLYKQYFGLTLAETTYEDYTSMAKEVITNMSANNLQPGDVLWRSEHVAIYIGNGQYVHASGRATGIKVSTYEEGRFTKAFRYVK